MNWGAKITILYVGFVIMILSLVGLTMYQNVDLESADYYEQELKFQDKIDRIKSTNELPEQLSWQISSGNLAIKFPGLFAKNKLSGNINLFRPSDAHLDKKFEISTDTTGTQNISTAQLPSGRYKLIVNWSVNGKDYYNEGVINLN